jgi:hypothetical protein
MMTWMTLGDRPTCKHPSLLLSYISLSSSLLSYPSPHRYTPAAATSTPPLHRLPPSLTPLLLTTASAPQSTPPTLPWSSQPFSRPHSRPHHRLPALVAKLVGDESEGAAHRGASREGSERSSWVCQTHSPPCRRTSPPAASSHRAATAGGPESLRPQCVQETEMRR